MFARPIGSAGLARIAGLAAHQVAPRVRGPDRRPERTTPIVDHREDGLLARLAGVVDEEPAALPDGDDLAQRIGDLVDSVDGQ